MGETSMELDHVTENVNTTLNSILSIILTDVKIDGNDTESKESNFNNSFIEF